MKAQGGTRRSAVLILLVLLFTLLSTGSFGLADAATTASAHTYEGPTQHAMPRQAMWNSSAVDTKVPNRQPGGVNRDGAVVAASRDAAKTAGFTDTIVLGHYPEYLEVAKATGGRTFEVPTKEWDSMTPEQQWGANQKFLDRAIARGSNVQLATPANAAREGSFYERELQYMQTNGYTVGPDGISLLAPGGG